MTRPRILVFSLAYEPLIGGAELAVRYITDRLGSPTDSGAGFDFYLITSRFKKQHAFRTRIGNVNVYRVGFGGRLGRYLYPVFAYRLAKRLHREKRFQIAWSIMAAYAGAAAMMFKRRHPEVKLLLTLQEGDPIDHIHRQVSGFRRIWQGIFQRADLIQAISAFLADWARREGALCPIEIVPNGVDLHKFKNQNSKIKITNQSSKITIITTSRLVPKNGIDTLIRAVAQLPTTNYQLLILGAGSEELNLKKLVKEMGVDERVEFLGNVDHGEVPKYLAAGDIFVRPSRSEGLGNSFLEAMAAGLPIIGTAVGGIPDFLVPHHLSPPREGEKQRGLPNGLFVRVDDPRDLAEKIKTLLDNRALRQKLGESGRRLVEEKYGWNSIAEQMNKIFQGLISHNSHVI